MYLLKQNKEAKEKLRHTKNMNLLKKTEINHLIQNKNNLIKNSSNLSKSGINKYSNDNDKITRQYEASKFKKLIESRYKFMNISKYYNKLNSSEYIINLLDRIKIINEGIFNIKAQINK